MVSFGLIGVGRLFDSRLIDVFKHELKNAHVMAVCDLDLEKATRVADEVGGDVEASLDNLLTRSDVDVVYIATESGNHFQHSISAIHAGKHVVIEKPPTLMPDQVTELVEEARKRDLMYAVILQNRFNPAMRLLKDTQRQGRFGKIGMGTIRLRWCRNQDYYEDGWHGTWEMDGGVVSQQAFHHLDALQWICGPVAAVVSAQTNLVNELEAEDTTVAVVKFANGGLGAIEATTAVRPQDIEASLSIVGENGIAVVGGIALNKIEQWEFVNPYPDDQAIVAKYSQEVPTGYGLSHGPLIQEIINRLESGELSAPFGGIDALPAIHLVHALYNSIETGGWSPVGEGILSSRLGHRKGQLN